MSLKREVNILQQENNHLRKLLELADSDSGISFPSESTATAMATMGLAGSREPLDGRGIWEWKMDACSASEAVVMMGLIWPCSFSPCLVCF